MKYNIRGDKRGDDKYLHQVQGFDNSGKEWVVPEYFKTEHITEEELQPLKDCLTKCIDIENAKLDNSMMWYNI